MGTAGIGAGAHHRDGVTAHLEADSVVLRSLTVKVAFRVLEQSDRASPVSQGLLLSLNEGRVLDIVVRDPSGQEAFVRGKVVRSDRVPNFGGRAADGQRFMVAQAGLGH